ncbi:hypothetical protein BJ912DRAFT_1126529 [Pholiota molesta]|nr:hypothetical protein BJ912DRAFT_1126529 [Pholiota molesta]
MDDLRIALFFSFFVQVGFFGTENVASISTFYLALVYRLIAIVNSFYMSTLLVAFLHSSQYILMLTVLKVFNVVAPYIMLPVISHGTPPLPHTPTAPESTSLLRAKGTEAPEQSVPSALYSAAAILASLPSASDGRLHWRPDKRVREPDWQLQASEPGPHGKQDRRCGAAAQHPPGEPRSAAHSCPTRTCPQLTPLRALTTAAERAAAAHLGRERRREPQRVREPRGEPAERTRVRGAGPRAEPGRARRPAAWGLTHPGMRDSIALLDNVGGEWERQGLGMGTEERLEALAGLGGAREEGVRAQPAVVGGKA